MNTINSNKKPDQASYASSMHTQTHAHYPVIIVGAGQAGLAMSYLLKKSNIAHLILDKASDTAENWQHERWDSFCLVTPNWQCQLPGFHYNGDDPNGFMVKEDIVKYIKAYRASFNPPIMFNAPVTSLTKLNGVFHVHTPQSKFTADQVVLACGGYHQPNILPFAANIPEHITQIHSRDYKNSEQLPAGEVMVIGTGQSGCQIAEDLHLAGRKVHLCVGNAPRVNRRYRGKDVVNWLNDIGYYKTTIDTHPDGENAPHATNHYVTGRDGGRDINLRIFAQQGMALYGKIKKTENNTVFFHDDLYANLDYADDVALRIRESIEQFIQANNISAPEDENIHSNFQPDTTLLLDLNQSAITSVVWATGFNMVFDWLKLPVISDKGQPIQSRGITDIDGLYFLGLNWMHTWGSGRFFHVGQDAEFIHKHIKNTLNKNATKKDIA